MCHSSKESRAICQSCVKGLGSSRRRARPSARMKQVGMEPQIPHLHQLRVPHADLPWTSRGFSSHFPTSHLHTYTPTHLQYHIRAADVVVTSMQAAAASNAPIPRPARRQATWASQLAAGRDGTGREELRFMSPGLCGQAPGRSWPPSWLRRFWVSMPGLPYHKHPAVPQAHITTPNYHLGAAMVVEVYAST
jgi:hypothetical protein